MHHRDYFGVAPSKSVGRGVANHPAIEAPHKVGRLRCNLWRDGQGTTIDEGSVRPRVGPVRSRRCLDESEQWPNESRIQQAPLGDLPGWGAKRFGT